MESWALRKRVFAAVGLPPVLWLTILFVVPLASVFAISFGQLNAADQIEISGTFGNYARSFDPLYLKIFGKSAIFAALTTAICLFIAFPVAVLITFAKARWRPWLLLVIMLPFWTNLLIRTYALIALLRREGVVNGVLGWFWELASEARAFTGFAPLHTWEPLQLLYNNGAVLFGLVYVHLPFMVLPLFATLDRLDRSLVEASLDLGAGHLRTMLLVVAPLAATGIVSGAIMTFVPAMGSYLTPDLMGGQDSQLIANVIERQFKRANDWPFGAALSFLLLYATLILMAFQGLRPKKRGALG